MRVQHLTVTTLFAVIVSIAVNAQTNYDRLWKKIDSVYYTHGLSRTAIADVEKIYAAAKREKNEVQLIKALIYKMTIEENFTEDGLEQSIKTIEKDITTTTSAQARSIMHSLAAKWYWNYLQNHRWNLYDRTETVNFKK